MFCRKRLRLRRRRGFSGVQVGLVAAVIVVVCIAVVQQIGREADTSLDDTATSVGDPSKLKNHFGGY